MSQSGAVRRANRNSGNILMGCAIVLGVIALLVIIGIVVVVLNWRTWVADAAHTATVEMIEQSELPEDQKLGMIGHVDRLSEDFKAGRIGLEEVGLVFEEVMEGPLMASLMLSGVEDHVADSGLSDEEKADALLQVQRFRRGMYEGSIAARELRRVTYPITEPDPESPHGERLKEAVTDEELREFVEEMRQRADAAAVPDEPYEVDMAEEFGKAIDRALGEAEAAE